MYMYYYTYIILYICHFHCDLYTMSLLCVCVFHNVQGLFSKRRQLILTDAPRLYYVDPVGMVLKGEIPW